MAGSAPRIDDIEAGKSPNTDGTAIAAGNVGETIVSVQNTPQTQVAYSSYKNITSVTLTPGVWVIYGNPQVTWFNTSSPSLTRFVISTLSTGEAIDYQTDGSDIGPMGTGHASGTGASATIVTYVNISSTATYYLNGRTRDSTIAQYLGSMRAVRIA